MTEYRLFWGDMHHNTYQYPEPRAQVPPLDEVLADVSRHLDFYGGAYYTACMRHAPLLPAVAQANPDFRGTGIEDWKSPDRLEREWTEFQGVTRRWNRPGRFVAFPGYEWQGDGTSGDHNVYGLREGFPIHHAAIVRELYARIRGGDLIAVPHHIGYLPGHRAPTWAACDESLTPFAEIHSTHGCSETDEDWVGLRKNAGMGPGASGGTYAAALARGLHLGAIASTDNWSNVPGYFGDGLMACLATELTRESLWEGFLARRVYAVTGDRIALDFRLNGALMGSRIAASGTRRISVRATGEDAIDRIELLRNGRVIATHCHQGTWSVPNGPSVFKLRIEAGWGAKPGTVPLPDRLWSAELTLSSGRFVSGRTYRVSPNQGVPELRGERASVQLRSRQKDATDLRKNSCVFEFEAPADARLKVSINGVEHEAPVAKFAAGAQVLWFREETYRRVKELIGVDRESVEREDLFYHISPKVRLHRAIPQAGFAAAFDVEDSEPFTGEIHYRVRVEQRNGQRAWSSPIWVRRDGAE